MSQISREATSSQSPSVPSTFNTQTLRERSCVLCKQRKVKCDRKDPCFNCSKAHVECTFRAPAPPRRRKKKDAEVNLVARLKQYEELLKDHGANVDVPDRGGADDCSRSDHLGVVNSVGNTTGTPTTAQVYDRKADQPRYLGADDGKMIVGNGRSRYLERLVIMPSSFRLRLTGDSNLWNTLSDEVSTLNKVHVGL